MQVGVVDGREGSGLWEATENNLSLKTLKRAYVRK